jgi:anti-anti-sigma regulatory factor
LSDDRTNQRVPDNLGQGRAAASGRAAGRVDRADGLRPGDHVGQTYASEPERWQGLIPYVAEGVALGEKVVYVAPGADAERFRHELRRADGDAGHDLDVEGLLAGGQLAVEPAEGHYTAGRGFDPDSAIANWRDLVDQALGEGWPGLRVAGEVAWLFAQAGARERWAAYELRFDLLTAGMPLTGMCCYDLREPRLSTAELAHAVHPLWLGELPSSWDTSDGEARVRLHGTVDGGLSISGELDHASADEVGAILAGALDDLGEPLLDVSSLRFVDVAAMRAIFRAGEQLARRHGRVQVRGASSLFRRVWELLRFDLLDPRVTLAPEGS